MQRSKRSNATRWIRLALGSILAVLILYPIVRVAYHRLMPLDTQAIYKSALNDLARDDLGRAQLAIELLSTVGSGPPFQLVLEGAMDLRQGRLQQAATRLIPALEDPATSALAYTLTGEAFYRNRQFAQAIEVLSRAIEIDDSLVAAHRWLAAAYYDIGATAPAIVELTRISELDRSDPRPHRLMGLIYKDMESFHEAIEQYRQALDRSSDFGGRSDVLLELATCLVETKKFTELDDIIAQCPPTATFLAYAAESLAGRGQVEEAMQKLDQSLSMEPDNLTALMLKGQLLLDQDDMDQALLTLKQAVEFHPFDHGVHHQLSQLYARQGEQELAQQHQAEATRLRELREYFSSLHAQASIDSNNADVRYQLGLTAQQLGLMELAASWFSAALALAPKHEQAAAALKSLAAPHALN